MNGADIVAEILRREETDFLSCYPRNPLIEACARIDIRPILCRQERVGVGMADGYSRINLGRKIGVFAPQAGPGIENAFAGVAQAYSENVPILVLPGAAPIGRAHIQPVFNAVDNFRHICKWAARVGRVEDLPRQLNRAFHLMRNGKAGPVLLEIPADVWEAEFTGTLDYTPAPTYRYRPDPENVVEAARALFQAENPVIFAGAGVLRAEASSVLVDLAEMLLAPVLTTNPGKSAFPENHPLSLGGSVVSAPRPLTDFLNSADLVLAIGSSLTTTPFGPNIPPGKKVIHGTNDISDINKDCVAMLGLVGDAKLTIEALLDTLKSLLRTESADKINDRRDMPEKVRTAKTLWLNEWKHHQKSGQIPINPYRVIQDLMETVDRTNVIITHDSGGPREQLLPFWECLVPQSYMGWGKSTQLGHSLGLTMGAKIAAPDKLCIYVLGDSAIGMVGMDLETAARNDIAILTIVLNNGIMAAERSVLIESDAKYGTMTVGGNYEALATSLGVTAFRVTSPDDLKPVFLEAIKITESGKPALVECLTAELQEFSRY